MAGSQGCSASAGDRSTPSSPSTCSPQSRTRFSAASGAVVLGALILNAPQVSNAQAAVEEVARLVSPDAARRDRFGSAVDIDGDLAIVGESGDLDNFPPGAAHIYQRDAAGAWSLVASLGPPAGSGVFSFGRFVAIDDQRVLVASAFDAFVFENTAAGWVQTAQLPRPANGFNGDVDLEGDRLLIGGTMPSGFNGAHIFERQSDGSWTLAARLDTGGEGVADDSFFVSADLSGDRAIVEAPNPLGPQSWADVFRRDASGTWSREARLVSPVGGDIEFVGIDGATAFVTTAQRAGLAAPFFIFEPDATGIWQARSGPTNGFEFALELPFAVVNDRVLRRAADGSWSEILLLQQSDPQPFDSFGVAVAISGSRAIVGAPTQADLAGAAYVFEFDPNVSTPPTITEVRVTPPAVVTGQGTELTATADDTDSGGSAIARMEFSVGGGDWQSMQATDGVYDEPLESARAAIPAFDDPGTFEICVRAIDSSGSISALACTSLEVRPEPFVAIGVGAFLSTTNTCHLTPTCPDVSGPASFALAARSNAPAGLGAFVLHFGAAKLRFNSTRFLSLTKRGDTVRVFGEGRVNGRPGFLFFLTAQESATGPDRIRVRIVGADPSVGIVYVTQPGGINDSLPPEVPLTQGFIRIVPTRSPPGIGVR